MFVVSLIHFQHGHVFLFEVNFLFNFLSLSSKSVFFTKLAISVFLAKFACGNLAAKSFAVNLLNYELPIYLP